MAYNPPAATLALVDDCIRTLLVPGFRRAHPYEVVQAQLNGGWFDVRPWCPACGYSLAYDQREAVRPRRWSHATCGSFGRHRWLIGQRRMRLLKDHA